MLSANKPVIADEKGLLSLLSGARQLEAGLLARTKSSIPDVERLSTAAQRLKASVIRPLSDALAIVRASASEASTVSVESFVTSAAEAPSKEDVDFSSDDDPAEYLWRLALQATAVQMRADLPTQVQEAAAALQDLACLIAPTEGANSTASRLAELKEMAASLPFAIGVQVNGPYLLTNVEMLFDWLGQRIPTRPQMALCRCGASKIKPLCDGSHASNGFTDSKDPKRVADREDTYPGQQITVLDNRGTCAHSGFCTDRLASVFHAGQEPFVSPSGGRMDDIVRAVRACPSGALSYALDGREARDQVDSVRKPAVEVSKDGPYRLTGGIPLTDGDGKPVPRNVGASLEHYSLCRCGHSQNKPFCSGMHWYVHFTDPLPLEDHEPTLFEWAGGIPALTRMTRIFYAKYAPEDPLIGPLFANMATDHPERVAAWLGEVFGGPKNYTEQYGGYTRMLSQHLGKSLTEAQRARWVALMCRSADEAGLPQDAEWRAAFVAYIEWGSRLALENSQPGAKPPAHMPVPRWWWVCDAKPGSRVSALAPAAEEPSSPLPGPEETVTFEAHVRHLFRRMDRQSMLFAFDLWAYDDVVRHAAEILRRLENGTMPCDGAWPKERVDTFRRWVESGAPA
jgi:CDGSH-type Zn-finger protein/truncated hemoglobin YjbI